MKDPALIRSNKRAKAAASKNRAAIDQRVRDAIRAGADTFEKVQSACVGIALDRAFVADLLKRKRGL